MFVYLARPIDQAQESSWLDSLTRTVESDLRVLSVGAYRPHLAFVANPAIEGHADHINLVNTVALMHADALVAILPKGMPTLGVPAEIETAILHQKPIVIYTDIEGSAQIRAWEGEGATVINLNNDPLSSADTLAFSLGRASGGEHTHPDRLQVKLQPGAQLPSRAYPTDAGLDLATLQDWVLRGTRVMIPTGVHVSIPEGWYGRITGRSSALAKWDIQVHEGIIDAGYTGELMIAATFLGRGSTDIPAGSRLAQLILAPVWDAPIEQVDQLPETARGTNGYGSSGR